MVNPEQACPREYTLERLPKPDFLAEDCSNISFQHLHSDRVLVGHEQGCYLTNIETNPPPIALKQFDNKEVVSLCGDWGAGESTGVGVFLVACEKEVYVYDERVSLETHQQVFADNSDEVNYITVNNQGHVAACDDAGEIKVYDLKNNTLLRSLRRKHTNICSCATFLPGAGRGDELITGGLDSQILAWDYKRVRVAQTINTQELLTALGDSSVGMFNPPFVYSIDVTDDGRTFAAGLGNGSLQLFKVMKGRRVLAPFACINKHSSTGVSAVCFIKPQDTTGDVTPMLVTGGNDGIVNYWAVPVDDPSSKSKRSTPIVNEVYEEAHVQSMLIASMDTQSKINFIGNASISNQRLAFVCDQTPSLKYFKI